MVSEILDKHLPIGFFDSGLGGVSVLAEAACLLPRESFVYYGDSLHNPYGTKEVAEIKRLSMGAVEFLIQKGIKALVVACNTATSVAISDLRKEWTIPVIGMEPALKPAVEMDNQGTIVVMATPITLREKKFNNLLNQYLSRRDIIPLSCPGLADLIERGVYTGRTIEDYLARVFSGINREEIATIVLGCTHYVFIKHEIEKLIPGVKIIDGNRGTVKHLARILGQRGLLSDRDPKERTISCFTSGRPEIFQPLCEQLFSFCQEKQKQA
ncbi:glutamate racemase [Candidatus Formimonas warabiya]|uniref:glutamate racemase n=1 Tax=Formimonas warabiya TaxID=1761012 RepID=UPI0011D03EAB